jgi:DNA-binding beta-propeller fold protein YncE
LALCAGCGSEVPGIDPPAAQIRFPIGLRVHPSDRYLLVANSNFDLLYNTATVVVVDSTTGAVDPRHTVRINSFASQLELHPDGNRVFVPSRSGNRLNVIDLDVNAVPMLRCTDSPPAAGKVPRCEGSHLTPVEINPFGVLVQPRGNVPVGCSGHVESVPESVLLTHINTGTLGTPATGILSVLEPQEEGGLPYRVVSSLSLPPGSNGIARHPLTGTVYVTSRFDSSIVALRVVGPNIELLRTITVTNARQGLDSRGIAFNRDGTRAYVANRSTPAVLVYDVSCGPEGIEQNRLIQVIDVGLEPGVVAYLRRADGRDRLYVPCSAAQQVYVIDAALNAVETIIEVGDGAYDIAFTRGASEQRGLQRAYVANFRDDAISVIELDETSPNFHREIARLRENPRLLP